MVDLEQITKIIELMRSKGVSELSAGDISIKLGKEIIYPIIDSEVPQIEEDPDSEDKDLFWSAV